MLQPQRRHGTRDREGRLRVQRKEHAGYGRGDVRPDRVNGECAMAEPAREITNSICHRPSPVRRIDRRAFIVCRGRPSLSVRRLSVGRSRRSFSAARRGLSSAVRCPPSVVACRPSMYVRLPPVFRRTSFSNTLLLRYN